MSGIGVVVGLAAEARIARRLGLPVAVGGGGGEEGAAKAVAELLAGGATALISFGLCGGLDPRLRPGDIVIPDAVVDNDERWPVDPALRARLGEGEGGALYAGEVLVSPKDKRNTHRTLGAVAVDVESAAVARAGVPFAVLRAVCDPANRGLPGVALVALDGRGHINALRVAVAALVRPHQIPSLLLLGRDAARARRALVRRVHELGRLEDG